MQNSTENVAKSPTFCALTGNRGRRIERRCLNLHRLLISASKVHFRVGVGEDQTGRFLRPEKAEQIPCGA